MKRICVTLSLIVAYLSLASSRPQSVQVEQQRLLHLESAELPKEEQKEKRGSAEETHRILQEINKINIALGYIPRPEYGFPRNAGNEGYFYPRQHFQTRPEFLTRPRKNNQQSAGSYKSQRAINPFNAQNYFYPAPYLHVPMSGKPLKFKAVKNGKFLYPVVYSPLGLMSPSSSRGKASKDLKDDSVRLGTIVVMSPRSPKSAETEKASKKPSKEPSPEESLIEEIVNYVPEALGLIEDDEDDDDDEEERQDEVKPTKPALPAIKNDKYLNLELKKHPHEVEGEESKKPAASVPHSPPPPPPTANRAFNFSNSIERIQNLTKQFPFKRDDALKKSEEITTDSPSSPSPEDLEEETEEKADDKEDEKSPFGFVFGPKQQLQTFKEGGLIIQRLRVRHGGIAIAGPGGVATAGSGGTAIVGPNGIAFTHPRFEQVDDSVRLPYIGGAKGQVLEIRQRPDGTIFSRILMDDLKTEEDTSVIDIATIRKQEENSFEANLIAIQQAAADLVAIQEAYKENGQLSSEQRQRYSQSLEKLGVSAQRLASIQGEEDSVRLLLEDSRGDANKTSTKKKTQSLFPPFNNNSIKEKEKEKQKEENCEEVSAVVEEGNDSTTNSPAPATTSKSTTAKPATSTTTKKPPVVVSSSQTAVANDSSGGDEESSVAEAKPVGLAIAGVGGVASSKPVGTAVVGPGGLAVARPQATAIAGLKPSDINSLGLPLPAKLKNLSARGNAVLPVRGKYGLVQLGSSDDDDDTEILVGPEFLSEARLSDKGIESSGDGEDEFDGEEKVDSDDTSTVPGSGSSKRPIVPAKEKDESNEIDHNKQVEPIEAPQFPYNIDFNKLPFFPPTFENAFSYQNPFLLPPNSYAPIPLANQFLQRRTALRYPPLISLYPSHYGQNAAPLPYSPYRLFYAPQ